MLCFKDIAELENSLKDCFIATILNTLTTPDLIYMDKSILIVNLYIAQQFYVSQFLRFISLTPSKTKKWIKWILAINFKAQISFIVVSAEECDYTMKKMCEILAPNATYNEVS